MTGTPHIPVLLREVLDAIAPRDGGIYVDGTFGAGGYSSAILEAAECKVFGIDRDPSAVARGRELAGRWDGRLEVLEGRYGDMESLMDGAGVERVDGVALDIGVSSMQIDQPERGFSFKDDGPLDMRMGAEGPTAADLVNALEEKDLADILWRYGEERQSRRIARAIVRRRSETPFTRTADLADVVRRCLPRPKKDAIDPATRTFQALRIEVNDELGELERGLAGAERLLADRGRLAVVSFHSLEDRIVKSFLRERSGDMPRPSRHLPDAQDGPAPTFRLLKKGTVKARDDETAANPRARSARLRIAERTDAPVTERGRP